MRIRVQRKIDVYAKSQLKFLHILLSTAETFRANLNINPDIFISIFHRCDNPEVKIFIDFESLAEYEEIFLHKILKDTNYLDSSGYFSEMIVDEPQDEMYARVEIDDFFMNRKHNINIKDSVNTINFDKNVDVKRKFRIEREYCSNKTRLADVLKMNFEFAENNNMSDICTIDYFCTRFSAERIGSAKIYWDSDDCAEHIDAFLQQDQEIIANYDGLLREPPRTRVYRRVDAELLKSCTA
jgi:hypothetical protein